MEELLELSEREEKRLEYYTLKQRETYIMKKYIYCYRFVNWVDRKKSTQTECWHRMNEHLISLGYKPKKSIVSVHRLWEAPFDNLDVEQWDYYGKEN